MRVAQMIDSLAVGGTQRMQRLMAEVFAEYELPLTVISLSSDEHETYVGEVVSTGAAVVHFPAPTLLHVPRLWALIRFLRRERFDLLHCHLAYANVVGAIAGLFSGTPVIASFRSEQIPPELYNPVREWIENLLLRFAVARIMANGHAVAAGNQQRVGRRKIDVLLNALEGEPVRLTAPEREAVRAELVGNASGPLLLAVGRMTPAKGYPDLLAAFKLVVQHVPSARLVIVGDGETMAGVRALRARLALEDAVVLAGTRKDVPRLLAAADGFVNASNREGTSVAILEAMAAGLPIVATEVGETSRLLADGCGWVVPARDPERLAAAVVDMLSNPGEARERGQAARQRVLTDFTVAAWTRQLMALYAEVSPAAKAWATGRGLLP